MRKNKINNYCAPSARWIDALEDYGEDDSEDAADTTEDTKDTDTEVEDNMEDTKDPDTEVLNPLLGIRQRNVGFVGS